jgi:hypothetical protein
LCGMITRPLAHTILLKNVSLKPISKRE